MLDELKIFLRYQYKSRSKQGKTCRGTSISTLKRRSIVSVFLCFIHFDSCCSCIKKSQTKPYQSSW